MSKISSNFLTMFALIQQEVSKEFILYMCPQILFICPWGASKKYIPYLTYTKYKLSYFWWNLYIKKNQVYIGKTSFVLLPSTHLVYEATIFACCRICNIFLSFWHPSLILFITSHDMWEKELKIFFICINPFCWLIAM